MEEVGSKEFKKVLSSTILCNVLVWYDYALYGALIDVIKHNFFPINNEYTQLMAVFATFAIGFVMRPIGSLFFGHVGDKYGRKKALMHSIITMSFPVLIISVIPDYSSIGILAPVLLILTRMVQGFSLGGEAGNAVFLLEYSPIKIRGLISSFEVLSAIIGATLASIVVKFLQIAMDESLFFSWGWRIAFFVGSFLGIAGTFMRHRTKESPLFAQKLTTSDVLDFPVASLFKSYKKKLLFAIGIDSVEEATLYVFLVFFASYVSPEIINQPFMQAMQVVLLILLGVLTLFFAYLSDIICSRVKVLMFASVLLLFASYPIFWAFMQDSVFYVLIGEVVLVTVIGASLGPVSAIVAEIFPAEIRYSALAVSRNISSTVFGGFAPMICLFLINITENKASVFLYFTLVSLVGIFSLFFVRATKIGALD